MASTLIDGYNLLHVTHLFGSGALAGTLQGARESLLEYLAARLPPRDRQRTTIVFDAAGAPPGLPDEIDHDGMRVLFARGYPDADAMLEDLIERARAPKSLLVVSGDRRVQRAARQRGAAWVESTGWFESLASHGTGRGVVEPVKPKSSGEVGSAEYWITEFSNASEDASEPPLQPPTARAVNPSPPHPEQPAQPADSPFPPGYADDLAKQLEQTDSQEPDNE